MKRYLLLGLWLGCAVACRAEQVLATYDWHELAKSGELLGGVPETVDGRSLLKIVNTNSTPLQLQLLKIPSPKVTSTVYALTGEVKYENVTGDGYLEMWNFYPPIQPGMPEGQFFSRTMAAGGEMGRITGTANWRKFTLPFDRTGASGPPTRLEFNLFLPGRGTVCLGPVQVIEYPPGFSLTAAAAPGAWWSDRAAGLIGGIGGSLLGCLGGLIGTLASRGKARAFVQSSLVGMMVLGGLLALGALAAFVLRQPYAVWFPLTLGSILLLAIPPGLLAQVRRQYEQIEMRRMAAVDAMG